MLLRRVNPLNFLQQNDDIYSPDYLETKTMLPRFSLLCSKSLCADEAMKENL